MSTSNNSRRPDNLLLYTVYAVAAYFGFQFIFKPKKAAGATLVPVAANATKPPPDYEPAPSQSPPAAKSATDKTVKWITEYFPLRKGMKGAYTKSLQKKLGVAADGAFGDKTELALEQQYGIKTLTQSQYAQITKGNTSLVSRIADTIISKGNNPPASSADTSPILGLGSKGTQVYRLQKWLGFKDKGQAKKGEPIADGVFGKQTQAALQKKTGQTRISAGHLSSLISTGSGIVDWLRSGAGIGNTNGYFF